MKIMPVISSKKNICFQQNWEFIKGCSPNYLLSPQYSRDNQVQENIEFHLRETKNNKDNLALTFLLQNQSDMMKRIVHQECAMAQQKARLKTLEKQIDIMNSN